MRYRDFRFPLTVTAIYMAVKLPLGFVATRLRDRPADLNVGWRTTVRVIIPLALLTSVEIGLSMCAYLFVSVTRITLVKSSMPAWQLLWGLLLRTERPSYRLFAVIALATGGLALATSTARATSLHGAAQEAARSVTMQGTALIVAATCLQGLRGCAMQLTLRPMRGDWVRPGADEPDSPIIDGEGASAAQRGRTTSAGVETGPVKQALLSAAHDHEGEHAADASGGGGGGGGGCSGGGDGDGDAGRALPRLDPISLVYLLAPWTTLFSASVALCLEGERLRAAFGAETASSAALSSHHGASTLAMVLGAGCLVFTLVLIELRIVQLTSALTLSVAGAVKECATIVIGHLILKEAMSAANAAGLACTLLGVHLYYRERTSVPFHRPAGDGRPDVGDA
jgi:drug/metabolite transporter (DMT)-like permease